MAIGFNKSKSCRSLMFYLSRNFQLLKHNEFDILVISRNRHGGCRSLQIARSSFAFKSHRRHIGPQKKMLYGYQTFVQIKAKRVCKKWKFSSFSGRSSVCGSERSKARHDLALAQVAFLAFCVTSGSGQNLKSCPPAKTNKNNNNNKIQKQKGKLNSGDK